MPRVFFSISAAILLTACGLKGDLYLPDQEPAAETIPEQRERERERQKQQNNTQKSPLID